MFGDKNLTLTVAEQVTLRMALNDRIRFLTRTLRLDAQDPLVIETIDMLAKLDAIPVMPV